MKFVLRGNKLSAEMIRVADPAAAKPRWEVKDRFRDFGTEVDGYRRCRFAINSRILGTSSRGNVHDGFFRLNRSLVFQHGALFGLPLVVSKHTLEFSWAPNSMGSLSLLIGASFSL